MKTLKTMKFGEEVAQDADLKYKTFVSTTPVTELSVEGNNSYDIVVGNTLSIYFPDPEPGQTVDLMVRADNSAGPNTCSVTFGNINDYDTFDYNNEKILSGDVKYYLCTYVGAHWLIGGRLTSKH